jgi:signal transduction histidine kinase
VDRRRTDTTIRRERIRSDRIIGGAFGTSVIEKNQSRRDTDSRLSVERGHMDAGLDRLSKELAVERASHSASEGALLTHQEFVSITSHDLRSNLSVVSINAALLRRHAERHVPREVDEVCVRSIQRAVVQMDRLVSDLLDLARIDVGKLEVKPQVEDVVQVARESVEAFRPVAHAKSVTLRAVLPDARLPARIDAPRIHQVLSNLLVNAIKFSPENGEVEVKARRNNRFVLVEVSDTGTGIPEGQLKVIFERYAQLKTVNGEGLGLGLYIARWIVDAHEGRIWARNNLRGGSTFGFCVPRVMQVTRGLPLRAPAARPS